MSHINRFQHLKLKLEAIQSATNNFSTYNCIGQGGFGSVYKGELVHPTGETMVALKRLNPEFGQGISEFWREIMMLSFYKHENIVSLLGYCDDHGEKILVYEYASNKSLEAYLDNNDLNWVQRLKICLGAARGLAYLHTPAETQLRIVHRDIKSSNILLDDMWRAKISDFGLSKFAPANNQFTFLVTNPAGTPGYIDPMYHETGLLTKESDVYSFGVVLFEVLCGRLCFGNTDAEPLIGLVRKYYNQKQISLLVYSNIKDEIDASSLKLFADIAYKCLKNEREERPLITDVVSTLERALDTQEKADEEKAKAKAKKKADAEAHVIENAGFLNVKVHKTMDARTGKPFDASSHSFIVCVNDLLPFDLNGIVKYNDVNGERNEEFTLYVEFIRYKTLSILVHEVVSVNKHCSLGAAYMALNKVTHGMPLVWDLQVRSNDHQIGDIKVEVLYKRTDMQVISSILKAPLGTPKAGGLLVIIIHGASLDTQRPQINSSVSLHFCGELRNTMTVMDTNSPTWLQEYTFMLAQPPTHENLHLEVNNDGWIGLVPDMRSFGCVNISLADVVNKKWTKELYLLDKEDNGPSRIWTFEFNINLHKDKRPRIGTLKLELQWRTSD